MIIDFGALQAKVISNNDHNNDDSYNDDNDVMLM